MIRVLFVCLGNICRSPMAEAVFQHKVRSAGLDHEIQCDSAGTGDWHVGNPPHSGTRLILEQNGIECNHLARVICGNDFDDFDIIATMDESNYRTVSRIVRGNAVICRFLNFAPNSGYTEMPDPYLNGNFNLTYRLVNDAADGLLQYLRTKYKL